MDSTWLSTGQEPYLGNWQIYFYICVYLVILFLIHQFNCNNWNKTCLFKTAYSLMFDNDLLSQKFLRCRSTGCETRKRGNCQCIAT